MGYGVSFELTPPKFLEKCTRFGWHLVVITGFSVVTSGENTGYFTGFGL
jgi:hypothetical protein